MRNFHEFRLRLAPEVWLRFVEGFGLCWNFRVFLLLLQDSVEIRESFVRIKILNKMDYQNGYGVEVTGLSPAVNEKDLIDFFSFSGSIEYIDIVKWVLLSPNLVFLFILESQDKLQLCYVVYETRSGEQACTAYVMFRDSYSQETAVLLSVSVVLIFDFVSLENHSLVWNYLYLLQGATILDQRVCITRWGQHHEAFDFWNGAPRCFEDETSSHVWISSYISLIFL